jgi:serine/threonine protein kinase
MGEVFVAWDTELHRRVAYKRLRADAEGRPDARHRFLFEAEVTARLEHPGIVPIYSLASGAGGPPGYAMRFVDGETFGEAVGRLHGGKLGGWNLGLRRLLQRLIAACQAVVFAHDRGIVHRDLKPANMLLGTFGETLIVDWGLAKNLATAESPTGGARADPLHSPVETVPGTVMGTPSFMPPEQAGGGEVGVPGDVYSLGATLYMLLAGRPPFERGTVPATLSAVRRGEVVPPRRVNRRVPQPLNAICLRAMALRPDDRYPGALELAADIERWLAGEPVEAWKEPFQLRVVRLLRRFRILWAAAGGAGLVLAADNLSPDGPGRVLRAWVTCLSCIGVPTLIAVMILTAIDVSDWLERRLRGWWSRRRRNT